MIVVGQDRKEGDARGWGKKRRQMRGKVGGDSQHYLVRKKRSKVHAAPGITPVVYALPYHGYN